jgi:hypothetical protein
VTTPTLETKAEEAVACSVGSEMMGSGSEGGFDGGFEGGFEGGFDGGFGGGGGGGAEGGFAGGLDGGFDGGFEGGFGRGSEGGSDGRFKGAAGEVAEVDTNRAEQPMMPASKAADRTTITSGDKSRDRLMLTNLWTTRDGSMERRRNPDETRSIEICTTARFNAGRSYSSTENQRSLKYEQNLPADVLP